MGNKEKIAVLDFGGQYAHLIANRIRRLNVFSEILDGEIPADQIGAKGIILSGGPQSVYDKNSIKCDPKIFRLGVPILGICYGHQLMAHLLKGKVKRSKIKEYGLASLIIDKKKSAITKSIFQSLGHNTLGIQVWMSHGDFVYSLPKGFKAVGSTSDCRIAAMTDRNRKFFGVQFHPEVTHTKSGTKILDNFLNICKVKRIWTIKKYLEEEMEKTRNHVRNKKVFMLVSGGIDSTVAFAFLVKTLGEKRVFGLFVDTGFLRKNEAKKTKKNFKKLNFKNLHIENASCKFISSLKDVYDPEEKRKIIGKVFLDVQKKALKKLNLNPARWILGQGTIYPDTIETAGTRHADKIKTHHNRVPEIEKLLKKNMVVEPLKNLYKDEVRALGEKLGLPHNLVWQHPFPGPGLSVRILCQKKITIQDSIEKIKKEITKKFSIHSLVLPVKSVGVQGDARTYRHPLAVFTNNKKWSKFEKISTSLTNTYPEINRVLLCISHKKNALPKITSFKNRYITKKRIKILQDIDSLVLKEASVCRQYKNIWQFPIILLPITSDGKHESIVLRPVSSNEAMTANFTPLPFSLLSKIAKKIKNYGKISMVFYDITNKPPATIEWE